MPSRGRETCDFAFHSWTSTSGCANGNAKELGKGTGVHEVVESVVESRHGTFTTWSLEMETQSTATSILALDFAISSSQTFIYIIHGRIRIRQQDLANTQSVSFSASKLFLSLRSFKSLSSSVQDVARLKLAPMFTPPSE